MHALHITYTIHTCDQTRVGRISRSLSLWDSLRNQQPDHLAIDYTKRPFWHILPIWRVLAYTPFPLSLDLPSKRGQRLQTLDHWRPREGNGVRWNRDTVFRSSVLVLEQESMDKSHQHGRAEDGDYRQTKREREKEDSNSILKDQREAVSQERERTATAYSSEIRGMLLSKRENQLTRQTSEKRCNPREKIQQQLIQQKGC